MGIEQQIKENLYSLYDTYTQHKLLFEYYQQNKSMRTREEIKDRLEYLKKNKIKQRSEFETLCWVLGIVSGENGEDEMG